MSRLSELQTPVFWAEGDPGPLSAEGWQVAVGGLVGRPATLSYEEVLALPKSVADARLTSVSGWSVRGKWEGVRLSDLLGAVEPKPEAAHVRFTSYRGVYTTCIPLDVAMRERTLLAYAFDGEPIEALYGGPLRIFCPYLWGYKSAKCATGIDLLKQSMPGFWQVRGYPDDAQIKPRQLLDVNSGQLRRIAGGEVLEFLD
ncbi:MAG: molybdopterin-binding oxidoreductase [Anaerolineales bacterium]|nr:MAG: molybdopterin-binding oxidoreductase [Anaerolineales bacterium]